MDLAERVIQANEDEVIKTLEPSPDDYYEDDMGYLVEKDIRRDRERFARYVYMRCRRLNPKLYTNKGVLYNSHAIIRSTSLEIAKLANMAEPILSTQAAWVYRRLEDTVPHLDESKIEISPGVLWDYNTLEIEEIPTEKYITIKQERRKRW